MAFATLELFRRLTHFSISDVSDTDVGNLISQADKAVIRLSTTEVYLEELEGNVDGVNVDFRTKHKPIADANADGSVDGDDVSVYYATYDDVTNWRELGSVQTVSSVQAMDGIIKMDTAPTEVTAEAGIFAIYRYDTHGKTEASILADAATYYLAYLVASKLKGKFPNYDLSATEAPYLRNQLSGADWLALCYETLGLQDKIFLSRVDGASYPEFPVGGGN